MEALHLLHYAEKLHHAIDHEMKGNLGEEITHIIQQHAIAGAGVGLVPIPIVGIVGTAGNTWMMYVRINEQIGYSFDKHVMQSIAIGIGTNLISVIPGILIGKLGAQVAKLIPVVGSITGAAIDSASSYALILVMGIIYVSALTMLIERGVEINVENVKSATREIFQKPDFVKSAFNSAKNAYRK